MKVEYGIFKVDSKAKTVQLSLRGAEVCTAQRSTAQHKNTRTDRVIFLFLLSLAMYCTYISPWPALFCSLLSRFLTECPHPLNLD